MNALGFPDVSRKRTIGFPRTFVEMGAFFSAPLAVATYQALGSRATEKLLRLSEESPGEEVSITQTLASPLAPTNPGPLLSQNGFGLKIYK